MTILLVEVEVEAATLLGFGPMYSGKRKGESWEKEREKATLVTKFAHTGDCTR